MPPFIRRVRIENFRSIASCDIELGPLSFIVGRNGSGKSNFLDALRLVSEMQRDGLWNALKDRGGIHDAARIESGGDIRISLELQLDGEEGASYVIIARPKAMTAANGSGGDKIRSSSIIEETGRVGNAWFARRNGQLQSSFPWPAHSLSADRPLLDVMSGQPELRPLSEFIANMKFYSFEPERMRLPHKLDGMAELDRSGENIGAAVRAMDSRAKLRVNEYLSGILPGIGRVEYVPLEGFETIRFSRDRDSLSTTQVSDGTLRALAVLTAALGGARDGLVGIEEPENALHPAAFGILRDALREGARERQILVTSQSPELLDDKDIDPKQIIAVRWEDRQSRIGSIPEAEASMLRDELMTAGELLHQGRLQPEPASSE